MIKWAIVATGNISNQFAQGLNLVSGASLLAVASRDETKAKDFADKYGAKKFYGSYKELASDSEVDVVYIGTPNDSHLELTEMYLNAGKHVLCEKPMGVNAKQTSRMAKLAREKNLFLMEAMWTRFFPVMIKVIEWLKDGKIGQPKHINANFGIESGDGWRKGIELSGGSLLDVGIYPLTLTFLAFGRDYEQIKGIGLTNEEGIDLQNSFIIKYKDKLASLSSAIGQRMNNRVYIEGTDGRIFIDGDFWRPKRAVLTKGVKDVLVYSDDKEVFEDNYESSGFQYEAAHVTECIEKGLTESPVMSLDESIDVSKAMDKLRKDMGVVYKED